MEERRWVGRTPLETNLGRTRLPSSARFRGPASAIDTTPTRSNSTKTTLRELVAGNNCGANPRRNVRVDSGSIDHETPLDPTTAIGKATRQNILGLEWEGDNGESL